MLSLAGLLLPALLSAVPTGRTPLWINEWAEDAADDKLGGEIMDGIAGGISQAEDFLDEQGISVEDQDWCSHAQKLKKALDSLTKSAESIDYDETLNDISSPEFYASTTISLCLGGALLLAPILLGPSWPSYLIWIVAALLGAIIGNKLMTATGLLSGHFVNENEDGPKPMHCVLGIAGVAIFTLVLAFWALAQVKTAFFCLGAILGGYLAKQGIGLAKPWLEEEQGLDLDSKDNQYYVWGTIAVASLLGGCFIAGKKDAIIDTAAGLFGALLVAQGVLLYAETCEPITDWLDEAGMSLNKFHSYWFAGIAAVLFLLRAYLSKGGGGTNEFGQKKPLVLA